ncbi:MAG TPA: CPBP family intramembrane metalloprotease [Spirochaetota bacterium]|nr:CPBP family intramembrane metalloprotease [Spirochaetota bacterium]
MIREELKALARMLEENIVEVLVLSLGTALLIVYRNHPLPERWMSHVLYFFALPAAMIILVFRRNPLNYGLRPGNWRLWLKFVGLAAVIIVPVLLVASRMPSMRNYYSAPDEGLGYYCLKMAALLFAWEFFFRGFLLFGLKEKFQEKSIFIQMVPFALMHLAKPEAEALSTVITGTLFGFIAYRSGSFWPAFIIHLMLNIGNRVIMEITR